MDACVCVCVRDFTLRVLSLHDKSQRLCACVCDFTLRVLSLHDKSHQL